MKKHFFILLLLALTALTSNAQRKTDPLDRGLVAVKVSNGVFVSWRQQAEEYYDVTYNLYRNGTKINSEPLTVTNFTDASGTTSSTYTVKAVVKGVEQEASAAKSVWANDYLEITPQHPADIHSTLVPNDACAADVDGDGQVEILLKYDNQSEVNNAMQKNGWYNEHTIFEVMNLDGSVRWYDGQRQRCLVPAICQGASGPLERPVGQQHTGQCPLRQCNGLCLWVLPPAAAEYPRWADCRLNGLDQD